ncbi:hypothetical protein LOTGIDRAFT_175001 [Lottia gigantea]|uniref:Uncharacterized protein n=1 Tax=Lottia gigantea TaxID=225164 RepID=V4AMI8_LOTGI|nr:hypothetical protein LOTGIDRAFT_175001 [Lottia gigantea]ESO95980.1 hypothetical protein LOTGIDRAFT_175001 [Lottia gigantea]
MIETGEILGLEIPDPLADIDNLTLNALPEVPSNQSDNTEILRLLQNMSTQFVTLSTQMAQVQRRMDIMEDKSRPSVDLPVLPTLTGKLTTPNQVSKYFEGYAKRREKRAWASRASNARRVETDKINSH